jgi:hypothetical protein
VSKVNTGITVGLAVLFIICLAFLATSAIVNLFSTQKQFYSSYPLAPHESGHDYMLPLKITLFYNGTKLTQPTESYQGYFMFNDETYKGYFINGVAECVIPIHTNWNFTLTFTRLNVYYNFQLKTCSLSDYYDGYFYCSPAFHWIKLDLYTREYWSGYD